MKKHFDVIVVGGGTGGASISKFLAQRGIEVALFERRSLSELHKICGDQVSKFHFNDISRIDPKNCVNPPQGSEFHNQVKGFKFHAPTLGAFSVPVAEESWIIAREKFGMRLLQEAAEAGVQVFDEAKVLEPLFDNSGEQVVGIKLKMGHREIKNVSANILVDASGAEGILRKHIDEKKAHWDQHIARFDISAAYREIVRFNTPIPDSDYARVYFDAEMSNGGYFWIFPQGPYTANVGVGVEPRRVKGGPKAAYRAWEKLEPKLFDGKQEVLHSGGATLPVRRPMDSLVYNGLVLIGDAGTLVRATDGAGIGFSFSSASHATGPIEQALQEGNFSRTGPLWKYNVNFMRDQGSKVGPYALIKVLNNQTPNKILIKQFQTGVVTFDDLYNIHRGVPVKLGLKEIISRIWKGRSIMPFMIKLSQTMFRMQKAEQLYLNFPDNWAAFPRWKKQIVNLYQDHKRALDYDKQTGSFVRQISA